MNKSMNQLDEPEPPELGQRTHGHEYKRKNEMLRPHNSSDGYLEKLKHKASIFGSWTNRYFRVNTADKLVEYYSSKSSFQDNMRPSGSFKLENLKNVRRFDENSFQVDAGPEGVYMLRASSAAQLSCWINELDTYIKARLEYERRLHSTSAERLESMDRIIYPRK